MKETKFKRNHFLLILEDIFKKMISALQSKLTGYLFFRLIFAYVLTHPLISKGCVTISRTTSYPQKVLEQTTYHPVLQWNLIS